MPAASASSATSGSPSQSEENTTRSARASSAGTSWRTPVSVTRSPSPSARDLRVELAAQRPVADDRGSARPAARRRPPRRRRGSARGSSASTSRPTATTSGAASRARRRARRAPGTADATLLGTSPGAAASPAARSPAARSSDTQVTASAPRSSTAAARYSRGATPWNVASTGGRRGPRARRAASAASADDARVVRVHDRRARAPDRGRQPRDALGHPGRRAPAVRHDEPLDRRAGELGLERARRPPQHDLVAALRQLVRQRDHDALGAADVGARRGEEDPHRASEALVERERPVDHRGRAAARLDVPRAPPPPGRARAPDRRAAARSPRPAPPGRRASTSSPVPSGTSSGTPPTRVATTGTPAAIASSSASGAFSM